MNSNQLSVDFKESANPSFRKPANESSRRNYRRHSPTVSHSPSPPSPGSGKRDRSPRTEHDIGGGGGTLKREKRLESENDAGKTDNGRGRKESDVDYRSRSRHSRSDDYDHKYNRRHGYHDRGYYGSGGRDSSRHDDGRYSRRSPERAARDRGDAENRQRRKGGRGERDDRNDPRDRHGYRERENYLGQSKSGGKRIDDAHDGDRRDKDLDDGNEGDGYKVDTEMMKERENRRDGIAKESDKDADRGKEHLDSSRKRSTYHSDFKKDEDKFPNRHGGGTDRTKHLPDNSKTDAKDAASGSALLSSDYAEDSRISISDVDDKLAKSTKWGPESTVKNNDSSPPDPEAARLAAIKAAQQVSINLGNFKSVDEKKKMLWRSKAQEPAAASGTIRWDTVQFADGERREKFKKLMGVKGDAPDNASPSVNNTSGLLTTEKQQELQQDLEKQFTAGLRRRDGRTVGLGL